MLKRLLTESHRAFGHWHVAGQEEDVLAGELTYEPERGLRLDVVGHFGGFPRGVMKVGEASKRHAIVLGRTSDQEITLYDTMQVDRKIKIPGEGSTTYQPSMALFGTHDHGEGPPSADQVAVRIPMLDAWLPISGLSTSMTWDESGRSLKEHVNRYEPVESVDVDLDWGRLRITPSANVKEASLADRNASISERLDFVLRLDSKTSFTAILNDRVGPLIDLASLVTSYVARPTYIGLLVPVADLEGHPTALRRPLDVLFQHGWPAESAPSKIDERRFLLPSHRDDGPSLEELIQRWYACRNKFKRTIDMLFGMERSPRGTYIEVRFLTLCHAAEAMHRDHELPQERYSKAEYKRLQRDALNALKDENAKAFLKEHLRHAMEISLKERMTALRDYSLGDEPDLITDEVITQIVRARNNLTHSSTRELKRLADSEDLYYLTQYVDWLLRSCFLVELGLATEDIAQMLEESDRFSWLRRATSQDCP